MPASSQKPASCSICRKSSDEVDFHLRSDTKRYRSMCKRCYNARAYHKTYRKRKREQDEKKYLEHQAKVHREWCANNRDTIERYCKESRSKPETRMKYIIAYAERKGIEVDMNDVDTMTTKLRANCFYCDLAVDESGLNGLDRVRPTGPYSDTNTVPCCATCNAMKHVHSMHGFLRHVRCIHDTIGQSFHHARRTHIDPFGGTRARRASAKSKKDELLPADRMAMVLLPCSLCSRCPSFGIDRIDANKGYTPDNCQPCCSTCNYMKKDMSLDEFRSHVGFVYQHTKYWVLFGDVPNIHLVPRAHPVGLFDAHGRMMIAFPSVSCAAMLLGVAPLAMKRAVELGSLASLNIKAVTHERYYNSSFMYEDIVRLVSRFRFASSSATTQNENT